MLQNLFEFIYNGQNLEIIMQNLMKLYFKNLIKTFNYN